MSRAKTMISKKKAPVRYYDYSEQFHRDEYVESDARSTISSGVHQAHAIPEEHSSTGEQEDQSILTVVAS